MSDWAKVGMECIVVDDSPTLKWGAVVPFKRGERVTISRIDYDRCIALVEHPNNIINGRFRTDSYKLTRFRPLVSKTESEDLAVFRRIADLAGVDEALRRLEGVE